MQEELTPELIWATAAALLLTLSIILATGWLLVVAARQQMPIAVVMALSVLALVSLIGYIAGGETRTELAAIAGTAVGALAGATTGMLIGRGRQEPPPETQDPPDEGGL